MHIHSEMPRAGWKRIVDGKNRSPKPRLCGRIGETIRNSANRKSMTKHAFPQSRRWMAPDVHAPDVHADIHVVYDHPVSNPIREMFQSQMRERETMSDDFRELRDRLEALENEVAELRQAAEGPRRAQHGVRKRSEGEIFGLPLWEIAIGPDPELGEIRGHAKGVLAVGDIATGLFAVGGIARGLFCVGGLALGVVSLGGVSLGLGFALGGAALGGVAVGGAAIGPVVIAGAGIGYYAKGAACFGAHAVNAMGADPQAVRFFADWFPGL
jgi:hypothetical protein